MFKSNGLKSVILSALLISIIFSADIYAADEILELIPADSLFCVRLNNFDYTLGQIDQFLAGASPMPMGVSMLARMQLAGLLGDPMLSNVNTAGSFAFFAVAVDSNSAAIDAMPNVFIGGVLPISNFQQFVSGSTNCSEPDAKGICELTSSSFGGQQKMLLTKTGNYALLTSLGNYDNLVAVAKSIQSKKAGLVSVVDIDTAKLSASEPLWIFGNAKQAKSSFGEIVSGQLQQFKTMMANMGSAGAAQGMPPAEIMNLYIGLLETLINETQSLSITINPKSSVLNLQAVVAAVPSTEMADIFTAGLSAKKENKLLGYFNDDAMVNFACKMGSPFARKINEKSVDLFSSVLSAPAENTKAIDLKALVKDSFDATGGDMAFSLLASTKADSNPGFEGKYIFEVRDADKFNKVMDTSAQLVNTTMAEFYKKIGMEVNFAIKRNVGSYKGVSIDSARFALKSTDPNSPQGQMIGAMYGDGLDYRWAMVGKLCVFAFAGDADATVKQLIDKVKTGSAQMPQGVKAATALIADSATADFAGTLNYIHMLKMITSMMPMPAGVNRPQINTPTSSCIAFAGRAASGKLTIDIALPKEHLTEIMTAVMAMQQQMMMQQQQMQQQGGE
ncbi:MAG: hypothetical protein KAQ89_04150 [Planctomycetes bacterium]|nr:hypothetical protein [Planctomycetota bacterium]